MERFFIVCPLVFLAGFVDSIAGGGGLISFPAYMLAGVPVHVTMGTSKLSSFPGAIVASIRFAKGGYIRWKPAVLWGICGFLGAVLGSNIALLMSERVIQSLMIVVLPIVAFYVLRDKKEAKEERPALPEKKMLVYGAAASLGIGLYDGFYGPGTGTFLILVFAGLVRLKIKEAAGLAKIVNFCADISALTTFFANGKVDYRLGLVAALFSIAGSYIGAGLVVNNGQKIVRPVVIIVLALLFIKIVTGQ